MSAAARSSEIFLPLAIVFKNSVPAIWKLQQKQRQQLWFFTTIFDLTRACQRISCKSQAPSLIRWELHFNKMSNFLQKSHMHWEKCRIESANVIFTLRRQQWYISRYQMSKQKIDPFAKVTCAIIWGEPADSFTLHAGATKIKKFHWISSIQSGRFEICHFVRLRNEISESM